MCFAFEDRSHQEIVLEVEEESVQWAAAGANATIYLSGIDPVHLRRDWSIESFEFVLILSQQRWLRFMPPGVTCPFGLNIYRANYRL